MKKLILLVAFFFLVCQPIFSFRGKQINSHIDNFNTVGLNYGIGNSVFQKEKFCGNFLFRFQPGTFSSQNINFYFPLSRVSGIGFGLGKTIMEYKLTVEGVFPSSGLFGKILISQKLSYLTIPFTFSRLISRQLQINAGYFPGIIIKRESDTESFGGAEAGSLFPPKNIRGPVQHSFFISMELMLQIASNVIFSIQPLLLYSSGFPSSVFEPIDYRPFTPALSLGIRLCDINWDIFSIVSDHIHEKKQREKKNLEIKKNLLEEKINNQIKNP